MVSKGRKWGRVLYYDISLAAYGIAHVFETLSQRVAGRRVPRFPTPERLTSLPIAFQWRKRGQATFLAASSASHAAAASIPIPASLLSLFAEKTGTF